VAAILDEAVANSATYSTDHNSVFAEITDEDIDGLFN
jgi:hypothetical protein